MISTRMPVLGARILALQTFLVFSILCTTASFSSADDVYTFVVKKQEDKVKSGWNLTDWLTTRDKMRMQDLWLALHSPSPYEFYLGANYQVNQDTNSRPFNAWEISFASFVSIFGLEGRYESGLAQKWVGAFDLRVFGFHDQSSNITLQAGLRSQSDVANGTFRNPFAGLSLTIYIMKYFGVEGLFRHYFPSTPTSSGVNTQGNRFQGGAFLDFKFLRVFGDYFLEQETISTSTGVILGTRIYF